ncbi:MAG: MBL fold metallo-hydrolase [Bacillota bacterium]|nr:MBL fold metallo-hydrolase [Bacillota bacterium]
MRLEFCTIASGSSGNCTYIGSDHTKILIDAGISGKRIEEGLAELKLTGSDIDALFITHEHQDHIKGAGILSRRFDIPVFATAETWAAMEGALGKIAPSNKRIVYADEVCAVNDICVKPFAIPHDAAEPVGYCLLAGEKKITLATDIGHVTDTIRENLEGSDLLLLESNHDIAMVKKGSYPWHLKQRILGERGHLSNVAAGELLAEVTTGKLKYAFLGHLSEDNNDPHLAYETVEEILRRKRIEVGTHLKMDMASRFRNGLKVEL